VIGRIRILAGDWDRLQRVHQGREPLASELLDRGRQLAAEVPVERLPADAPLPERLDWLTRSVPRRAASIATLGYELVMNRGRLERSTELEKTTYERDLELHNVRRSIFDTDVVRTWERRSLALESVGDALYLLFARDFAPLPERLDSIASRLEGLPAYLDQHRTRALGPQVRLWQRLEMESAESLPGLIWDIVAAASGTLGERRGARLQRAAETAAESIGEYRRWLEDSLANGTDDWALGREHYDELVGLRALEGLDSDQILAIGWEQLEAQKAARIEAARRLDPSVDEATVVDRVKSDHPATFAEALEAYRQAMTRARQYLIDHRIATVPEDEQIIVRETPRYLRHVIPFAAYFEAPKFDLNPTGLYIVTSAVHDDPDALREHYRA